MGQRRWHRTSLALVAGLLLIPALWAVDETAAVWIRGTYTEGSPRPVALAERAAWHEAGEMATRAGSCLVLVGTGRSMQPLYPAGTILVLQEVDYDDLQRGQTALYRNRNERAVAHVLVAKARDGWRARGLNNRLHDMEPVVPGNLLGVVVAAYVPLDGERRIAAVPAVARGSVAFLVDTP